MKKIVLSALLIGLMAFGSSSVLFAKCEGGKCPLKKQGHSECGHCQKGNCGGGKGSCDKGGGSGCPIVAKFCKKACFFLENQTEIGLSEDQVSQIKALQMEVKKASIRAEAEMKIFHMDMEEKLSQPKVDVEGLNAMIDSGSSSMAAGAKENVAAYAKLKSILTDQQFSKAKEIWKKK